MSFSAAATDADGDPLTYDWEFGDGAVGRGSSPSHVYTAPGPHTASVTVSDGRGKRDAKSVVVQVGAPPTATIDAPATYRDGVGVELTGHASDPDEGALAGAALHWKVVLHHASHVHPLSASEGVAAISFTPLTDHDADAHYDISLTATDSTGLTGTATRRIDPETVAVALRSEPSGAALSYAGLQLTAPQDRTAAIGFGTSVSAAPRLTSGGRLWAFDHWSDGGARLHDVSIPASPLTLTAVYRQAAEPVPVIAAPAAAATYRNGRPVALAGSAADEEDGTLPSSARAWSVVRHDGAATTEVWSGTGASGSFTPGTDGDAGTWYEVRLTVADADGMSATVTRAIHPRTMAVALRSEPAGAPLTYAGTPVLAPDDRTALVGSAVAVAAAPSFAGGDREWLFDHWSDGGAREHEVVMPDAPLTLTAVYRQAPSLAGPVLALGFDEGRGRIARDTSGNRNDGALHRVGWVKGRRGGAVALDGRRSWVTVADAPELRLGEAVSVEAWVRPDRVGRWSTIVAKEAPRGLVYGLFAGGPGIFDGPVAAVGPLADAVRTPLRRHRWTHVAMTFDGVRLRAYVDGVLTRVAAADVFAGSQSGPLRIGGNGVWRGEQFDGAVDDVSVWPRALTGVELAGHAGRAPGARPGKLKQACVMRGAPRGTLGRGRAICRAAAHRRR